MGLIVGYHAIALNEGNFDLVLYDNSHQKAPHNHLSLLDFALEPIPGDKVKKVCYDLDYFTAVMLRDMRITEDQGQHLADTNKLHYYDNGTAYDITYYPAKYLGITRGTGWNRPYAGFYNMEQYFDAVHYDNPAILLDYCKGKARAAKSMGVKVTKALFNLGLDPDTLTSPARSMEKSIMLKADIPNHENNPADVNDYALKCCPGNWVEAFKLGYFDNAYDLDITSCYASILTNLLDTRRGSWISSPTMPKEAVYGFAEGEVSITADFSPIFYNLDDELNYTPSGSWHTYLTKGEIDFIYKYNLGSFDIKSGWWWIPSSQGGFMPYRGVINYLYKKRAGASKLEGKILKRCLAALWGKTLSKLSEGYGPYFNPVYGSIVESEAKLKVASFVLDNNLTDNLLHIAVDGILVNKPVTLPEHNGLGSWRVSHAGKALIVNSGIAAVEGKAGAEDFAISLDWLLKAIKRNPEADSYTMRKYAPITLAKALNTDFNRLGLLERTERAINIGQESKRLYWDLPHMGKDLLTKTYDSEPLGAAVLDITGLTKAV